MIKKNLFIICWSLIQLPMFAQVKGLWLGDSYHGSADSLMQKLKIKSLKIHIAQLGSSQQFLFRAHDYNRQGQLIQFSEYASGGVDKSYEEQYLYDKTNMLVQTTVIAYPTHSRYKQWICVADSAYNFVRLHKLNKRKELVLKIKYSNDANGNLSTKVPRYYFDDSFCDSLDLYREIKGLTYKTDFIGNIRAVYDTTEYHSTISKDDESNEIITLNHKRFEAKKVLKYYGKNAPPNRVGRLASGIHYYAQGDIEIYTFQYDDLGKVHCIMHKGIFEEKYWHLQYFSTPLPNNTVKIHSLQIASNGSQHLKIQFYKPNTQDFFQENEYEYNLEEMKWIPILETFYSEEGTLLKIKDFKQGLTFHYVYEH